MLHRRDAMLRLGQVGLGGLTLPGLLAGNAIANSPRKPAKSCILLYLWGGPPQQDMFDMKPVAPEGIRSEFKPIDTVVPGVQISDQLPLMARHTDKMAIVRSFTHPSNTHEVGVYHTLTGKVNNTLAVPRNYRARTDFPNMGAVVSYFTPPGPLPASVTVPRPIGHDGVIYTGTYAGFLGSAHDPLELKPPAEVNVPPAHSFELPPGLDADRLAGRLGLLKTLEVHQQYMESTGGGGASPSASTEGATRKNGGLGLSHFREQAFRMLTSPDAKRAFDLDREEPKLRDRFGRNEYGECFLLARRLIESGVKLVTMTWYYVCKDGNVANVWDNHGGTGSLGGLTGYQMLKADYCLPPLDMAYSALLDDLSQRGLLDETLVVMLGEFGRTPQINKNAGRDHWGACQSIVLAGGGIAGGRVYGSSDKHAAYPASNPVAPEDLIATVYDRMGIPPESVVLDPQNRPHHVSEGTPLTQLYAGNV